MNYVKQVVIIVYLYRCNTKLLKINYFRAVIPLEGGILPQSKLLEYYFKEMLVISAIPSPDSVVYHMNDKQKIKTYDSVQFMCSRTSLFKIEYNM